jgi:hypothetical protein
MKNFSAGLCNHIDQDMRLPCDIWFRDIAPYLAKEDVVFFESNKEFYNIYMKTRFGQLEDELRQYGIRLLSPSIHLRHVGLFLVRMHLVRHQILGTRNRRNTEIESILNSICLLKTTCERMTQLAVQMIRNKTPYLSGHRMPHGCVRHFLSMLESVECISELIEAKYPQLREDFLVRK